MIWMWDGLQVGLEPQPWHYNITWAQPYPDFLQILPRLAQEQQSKGGPICPYTA